MLFLFEDLLMLKTNSILISMEEKTLLHLALAAGVLGLVVLFMLSRHMTVDGIMISRLDEMVDESVLVTGVVVDVTQADSTTFIMLEQNEMTSVVVFGGTPMLAVGDLIQVRGKVVRNEEDTEIIGEEIRVV